MSDIDDQDSDKVFEEPSESEETTNNTDPKTEEVVDAIIKESTRRKSETKSTSNTPKSSKKENKEKKQYKVKEGKEEKDLNEQKDKDKNKKLKDKLKLKDLNSSKKDDEENKSKPESAEIKINKKGLKNETPAEKMELDLLENKSSKISLVLAKRINSYRRLRNREINRMTFFDNMTDLKDLINSPLDAIIALDTNELVARMSLTITGPMALDLIYQGVNVIIGFITEKEIERGFKMYFIERDGKSRWRLEDIKQAYMRLKVVGNIIVTFDLGKFLKLQSKENDSNIDLEEQFNKANKEEEMNKTSEQKEKERKIEEELENTRTFEQRGTYEEILKNIFDKEHKDKKEKDQKDKNLKNTRYVLKDTSLTRGYVQVFKNGIDSINTLGKSLDDGKLVIVGEENLEIMIKLLDLNLAVECIIQDLFESKIILGHQAKKEKISGIFNHKTLLTKNIQNYIEEYISEGSVKNRTLEKFRDGLQLFCSIYNKEKI